MKKFFQLSFLPRSSDLALLIMRLGLGVAMVGLHGWPKLVGWAKMRESFPDPLAMGTTASLACTITVEIVAATFLLVGFCSRFAALALLFEMSVAFFMVHGAALSGSGSGERALVYALVYLGLFVAGPGTYSIDRKWGGAGV